MSRRQYDSAARALLVCASMPTLAGCAPRTSAPVRPAQDLPAQWAPGPAGATTVTVARWWTLFADPALERLVDEALKSNLDLSTAVARIDEARALAAQADAQRRPVVDATMTGDRQQSSLRTASAMQGTPRQRNDYRLTLNASYEIDLWDRLANASAVARSELLAAEAARDTVRMSVAAEVARAYFALRALDAKIDVAARAVDSQTRTLELQRRRVEAGMLAALDLRQIESELAALRARIAPLEGARTRGEAALAALLGRSPRALMEDALELATGWTLVVPPPVVPAGLPSELLLRRPDIVEAERRLEAANARVAAARVAHFPSVSLTGHLGMESAALTRLFGGPAGVWQVAALIAQPVYAGGRLQAQIDAATARENQALLQYQKAIQSAFRDIRTALAAQAEARSRQVAEQARVTALQDTVRLARMRYEGGVSSQLDLLDAERALLAAQINRIETTRAGYAAIADLVQALGGGWEGSAAEVALPRWTGVDPAPPAQPGHGVPQ